MENVGFGPTGMVWNGKSWFWRLTEMAWNGASRFWAELEWL
jgi:hypothetical protein